MIDMYMYFYPKIYYTPTYIILPKSPGAYTPVLFKIVCASLSLISLCLGIVSFFTPFV